jgi:beta-galactosidase
VVHTIQDADGRDVATSRPGALTIAGRGTAETVQQLTVSRPSLWSVETPYRYRVVTTVESNGREVDHYETPFGIRTMRFDANDGFLLNGRRVELKGTCNHQDHAGVGAALPDAIQYYRIQQLKEMGSNAYRTSHNPPTPELLEACDALGMLVLDETRMFSSEAEGLSQLERMIRRDRNHPCIVAWSIFNEEWGEQGTERGARLAATMKAAAHRLDPTRPVTAAMDGAWGGPVTPVLDVQGCNYERPNRPETNLESFRRNNPRKPVFGSEVASTYCTRGVYTRDAAAGYVSAYDVNKPSYGATAEEWWTRFAARPWLAGGFVWTGFDYRGEPSPYAWPCISSHFGIMDTCGFPKDNFFYYQAWWGDKPVLHLFPHWNWPGRDGEQIEVWVHANVERVELLLNDRSLGAQEMPRNGHLVWHVPYAPGRLVARGFTDGRQVLERVRATPGAAARIVFSADRAAIAADGEDAAVVTARVTDNAGLEVATANHLISFTVTGSGKLIGVGNGDPSSHESDKAPERRAFNGLCCAIVQASKQAGAVRVKATSPGLAPAEIAITCSPAKPRASA